MSTGVNSGRPDPTQESVLSKLYKPSGSHPPAGTGGLPADQVKFGKIFSTRLSVLYVSKKKAKNELEVKDTHLPFPVI